jgi:hypothetical protein
LAQAESEAGSTCLVGASILAARPVTATCLYRPTQNHR